MSRTTQMDVSIKEAKSIRQAGPSMKVPRTLCLRKMERELCPFARFALHLDISPVCLYNAARDGESQPGAAGAAAARARSIAAIEALEDVRDVPGMDAFARVADGHIYA